MFCPNVASYVQQLDKLEEIIDATNSRLLSDEPDSLFSENVNFFTKSYLINLCAVAEACLKDVAMEVVRRMALRLAGAKVSSNIIFWSIFKESYDDKKHSKNGDFSLEIVEDDISKKLSANPWKAIKLFKMVGCNIEDDAQFTNVKNIIGTIVEKRNNIIHHNDEANDLSLSDVRQYVGYFRTYLNSIITSSMTALNVLNVESSENPFLLRT